MNSLLKRVSAVDRGEWIRVVVYATAAALFVGPRLPTAAMWCCVAGTVAGVALGRRLGRSRARTGVAVLLVVVGLVASALLRKFLLGNGADWFGVAPAAMYVIGTGAALATLVGCTAAALRFLSARMAAARVLEGAALLGAAASALLAHRQGAINRPFSLADAVIAMGEDPRWIFVIAGGAAVTLVSLALIQERSRSRWWIHACAAVLLLLTAGTLSRLLPVPESSSSGLSLRGEPKEQQEQPSNGSPQNSDDKSDDSAQGKPDDSLEFRDEYDPGTSRPVAVVIFHTDFEPPFGVYYFRQGAFSQYNGVKLVEATSVGTDRDVFRGFPTYSAATDEAPPPSFFREPVETTVALLSDHNQPFALETGVELTATTNPDPSRFRRTYRVTSMSWNERYGALVGSDVGSSDWTPQMLEHYTRGPENPKYKELATKISSDLPEEYRDSRIAHALSILDWLSKNGHYSLKSQHAGSDDPTASFLFGDLTGYCVHFAHAAAFLLRSIGIPARVATGYALESSARRGGSALLINDNFAHAWAEFYVEGAGWIVADVFPQSTSNRPPEMPDPDLQRLLGELARGASPLPPDANLVPALRKRAEHLARLVGYGLAGGLAALIAVLYAIKIVRRALPRWVPLRWRPRWQYRAVLDRLSDLDLTRTVGESREAHAHRLRAVAPSFESLTALHARHAFGPRLTGTEGAGATAAAARQMHDLARRVAHELREHATVWRRALGWLVPWSWIQSR